MKLSAAELTGRARAGTGASRVRMRVSLPWALKTGSYYSHLRTEEMPRGQGICLEVT